MTVKTIRFNGPEMQAEKARMARMDLRKVQEGMGRLMDRPRDHNAEAAALPHFSFDLKMHEYLLRSFSFWMGDGVSALEMGCFEGAFTKRLREVYPDLTVVEASKECIKKASAVVPADVLFIHGTFETVELERRYDAIFLTHVLEHLDDPAVVLKRCREWLLPEGRVFIAVPNGMALSRQIAAKMGLLAQPLDVMPAEETHGHRRTYDKTLLWNHIEEAGLTIVDSGGVVVKPISNWQWDAAMREGIVSDKYLEACYALGREMPEICSSLYAVCE